MNEVTMCLEERRSCRSYKSEQISDSELNEVLSAGEWAASGMGRQSPVFVVIQKKDDIERLSRLNASIMNSSSDPFYGAPTVILVLVDKTIGTCVEDGACAIQNMMDAAHSLGLGSCWIHRAKEEVESEEGKRLLASWGIVGDNWRGVGHCILGYPESLAEKKPRKDGRVIFVR